MKSPRNHLRFQLRCQTAQGAQGCDQDLVIFGGNNYENHQPAIDFTIFYPHESGINHYESLLATIIIVIHNWWLITMNHYHIIQWTKWCDINHYESLLQSLSYHLVGGWAGIIPKIWKKSKIDVPNHQQPVIIWSHE